MVMKIFKVSQDVNNDWDTYDSMIVIAKSRAVAQHMHPDQDKDDPSGYLNFNEWCDPIDVKVEFIGLASSRYTINQVIVSSFNAG